MKLKYIAKVTFILSGLCIKAVAQQQPLYTQYILNPFITNPALAGIENYWDVKLSYRNQWQGINNAPQTSYLTIQGPLKHIQYSKPTTATVSPRVRKKVSAVSYWTQYRSIVPHAGLGFTFLNDRAGPINRYAANVVYAYHIGLSKKVSLSAGLAGGLQGVKLNTDLLNFGSSNPADPAVTVNGVSNQLKPDLSFGLWVYSAFYFVGASAQSLVPVKLDYSNTGAQESTLVPHLMISAGYKVFLNENINFLPSTTIRVINNAPLSFDVNAKLQYRDVAWGGISYRHPQSFAAMLGMYVNSTFNFGYSYDFTNSRIKSVTNGTHEIVLGILLGNRNKVLCPREFW